MVIMRGFKLEIIHLVKVGDLNQYSDLKEKSKFTEYYIIVKVFQR